MATSATIATWHRIVRERDLAALDALLDEEAVFHSPVVHTPQRGRKLARMYLSAALGIFSDGAFRYVREIAGESEAMLEFETEIDGVYVNGVDIIRWNAEGRIVEFKVLLRPMKALDAVRLRMVALLEEGEKR